MAFTTLMAIRTAVRGKRHMATEQTKLLIFEIILIDSSKCDVTSSTACVFFSMTSFVGNAVRDAQIKRTCNL